MTADSWANWLDLLDTIGEHSPPASNISCVYPKCDRCGEVLDGMRCERAHAGEAS